MSIIDTLITDRSSTDVMRWKYLRDKGWDNMSSTERTEWLGAMKGAYDYTDLNRIGEAVAYLAALLNEYGYSVTVSPKTDWAMGDIPQAEDMEQYLADVEALKAAFYGTTALPATMTGLTAEAANNIETLLQEIETNIKRMTAAFRHCGTTVCGMGGWLL